MGNRRDYPEPGFNLIKHVGPGGRCSYELTTKVRIVEYTRAVCEDGYPVGVRGVSYVFGIAAKRIRGWLKEEKKKKAAIADGKKT